MGHKIPLKELSVDELFNSSEEISYEIPIYQRNYAWEIDEITALLNDVWDACQMNKKVYYIGTLVSYARGNNTFEVIDGQQRLTTLYLIMRAWGGNSIRNKLTYRARQKSNDAIEALNSENNKNIDQGIYNGYRCIKRALNEIEGDKNKEKFINYLRNQVHIIHYNVPRDVDLNHYFEVMNSRGEQLEKHEIVKSKLIAYLEETERNKFAAIWQACSEMNVYIQMRIPEEEDNLIFEPSLKTFKYYDASFDDLPEIGQHDDLHTFQEFIDGTTAPSTDKERTGRTEIFQPIIDFPNFLLIVLKITQMESPDFEPEKFILDDKELINAFENAHPNRDFVKRFGFNLLKAKYLLDNYVVHHVDEIDMPDSNPWQLEHWQHKGDSYNSKNLSDDNRLQNKLVQQLSMFEVSFTPRQRKNYLFYSLYHLFGDNDLEHYVDFLSKLADKYFFDIYLEQDNLNKINTPLPRAFDSVILKDGKMNLQLNQNPSYYMGIFGNGTDKSEGIPLFVFNYLDYKLWLKYAETLLGMSLKEDHSVRKAFFEELGCSDFGQKEFDQFYFSRTRRSLEHFYPQANVTETINEAKINCFGNYAMIGSQANSSGSYWTPRAKIIRYLDQSEKISRVSVASLKLRIMMQICRDNDHADRRKEGEEWAYEDMKTHQEHMLRILKVSK